MFDGRGQSDSLVPLHYLTVVNVDRTQGLVTLRNPWGDAEQGSEADGSARANRPERRLAAGDAGTITMSLAEFNRILRAMLPPADH